MKVNQNYFEVVKSDATQVSNQAQLISADAGAGTCASLIATAILVVAKALLYVGLQIGSLNKSQ